MFVEDAAAASALNVALHQVEDAVCDNEQLRRRRDQLRMALEHRTLIWQAQRVAMECLDIEADAAFDYLRRVSMDLNRRLVDIAEELVRTRVLPDVALNAMTPSEEPASAREV